MCGFYASIWSDCVCMRRLGGYKKEAERTTDTILRSISNRMGACRPCMLRCRVSLRLSCVSSHCEVILIKSSTKRAGDGAYILKSSFDSALIRDLSSDVPSTVPECIM